MWGILGGIIFDHHVSSLLFHVGSACSPGSKLFQSDEEYISLTQQIPSCLIFGEKKFASYLVLFFPSGSLHSDWIDLY